MPRLNGPRDPDALASLIYRSRACDSFSEDALLRLLARARTRNAEIAVTGVLVYERDRFFQCVEGPEASLTIVMDRIRSDPRHVDLEILAHQGIPSRLFPAWHMKLARRAEPSAGVRDGVILAEVGLLDALHTTSLGVQTALMSLSVLAWQDRNVGRGSDPGSSET
jgi:hypothetical protein